MTRIRLSDMTYTCDNLVIAEFQILVHSQQFRNSKHRARYSRTASEWHLRWEGLLYEDKRVKYIVCAPVKEFDYGIQSVRHLNFVKIVISICKTFVVFHGLENKSRLRTRCTIDTDLTRLAQDWLVWRMNNWEMTLIEYSNWPKNCWSRLDT